MDNNKQEISICFKTALAMQNENYILIQRGGDRVLCLLGMLVKHVSLQWYSDMLNS